MDSLKKKEKIIHTITTTNSNESIIDINTEQSCINPSCFFCTMKEPNSMIRRAGLQRCFKEMPSRDNQALVVVLSGLWNIAMTQPDDPEFPSLGVFRCMASLIQKGIDNKSWLLKDQNIYIPYYAAHIIGSYTMNKAKFAEKAVQSGVIPPLMDLLRGKISWVEQRVAVRALSHLASYEKTFDAVAMYEENVVKSAMNLASNCLEVVYTKFVGVPDAKERLEYHRDLLTRGVGGLDENRKAEEWACQLQRWSLYLLNCFACKERSLNLICRQEFLKDLCEMWGGLVNHESPAGVGLIRILCYSKHGRKSIAESKEVVIRLCHISRSSDDWQYIGIDCLLLLLKDQDTRFKVLEISALFLVDLVELRSLADRSNVGEEIARVLLFDYRQIMLKLKSKEVQKVMQEIWDLKVERRKREKTMPKEMVEERRVLVGLIKQQGNHMFCLGDIEEALAKYTEALDLCPLRLRKERVVLYSDRAQCRLLLGDPDAAISDSTRALCLSTPANSHSKSLWRRSQAFDRKSLAKESLMDCVMFLNSCVKTETAKGVKIPYHAARMISKQMEATWIFANLESKASSNQSSKVQESKNYDKQKYDEMMRIMIEKKGLISTIKIPNMLCLEDTETTTEEADLLTRSSKKVKIGDNTSSSGSKVGNTYIESLMGDSFVEPEGDDDIYNSECISDDDEEDCDEDDCPVIKLSAEEKKRIRAPWNQTLIIKLMGRRVGYMFLIQRLKYMWKLRGDFTLTDLGNEFYLAKFANTEDRAHVLFEGPWMVADHYLTVRTWHPNFDPFEASIDKVAVWVRLPDLAMEYYDTTVLWKIGDSIGRTLKIDRATSVGTRGKFARLCVEVDLTKPLLAKFKLRRRIRRIMYEGLHLVCFKCGQYGHKQELCPNEIHAEKEEMRSMDVPESPEVPVVRPEVMESFGTWMIAERRPRLPSRGPVTETKPADGKRGSHAEKYGDTAETLKEGTINISTRYDVLLKVNENAGFGGADENGERKEEKEIETQMAEKRDLTQEDGRSLGRKKQRAG